MMSIFYSGVRLSDITHIMEDRDNKIIADIKGVVNKETDKLDKLIQGMNDLDKGFATLSATVSANHSTALLEIQRIKDQMSTENSEKYATKKELSNGLNALRTTAKVVWTVAGAVMLGAVWLSDKGIL